METDINDLCWPPSLMCSDLPSGPWTETVGPVHICHILTACGGLLCKDVLATSDFELRPPSELLF